MEDKNNGQVDAVADQCGGLVLDEKNPASGFEVVKKAWPEDNAPFEINAVPIQLRAKAKKIVNWQQDHLGMVGIIQQSPVKSDEPEETVTLVPMGAARLRISAFGTRGISVIHRLRE